MVTTAGTGDVCIPFPPFPRTPEAFGGLTAENRRDTDRPWEADIETAVAVTLARRTAPVDRAATIEYLRHAAIPPGRYYLYGTGQLTVALLPILEAKPEVTIAGFLDRNAGQFGDFAGRKVITPEDLPGRPFDRVMPLHLLDEPAMIDRLLAAGVPDDAIVRVQTNPAYIAWAVDRWQYPPTRRRETVSTCIVSTLARQWSLVPHPVLAEQFDPARTINLFYGVAGHAMTFADDVFELVDCQRSIDLLLDNLRRVDPQTIYLKLSAHAHSEILGSIVRRAFPHARLICELNDWAALFSDDFLVDGALAYGREQARAARLADYDICHHADLIVCKSGGPWWDRLSAGFPRPCVTYFPTLPTVPVTVPPWAPQDGAIRMLFAGSIAHNEREEEPGPTQGCQFQRYLRTLATAPDITVDVFNSGHFDAGADDHFAALQTRLTGWGVNYHRLTPFEAVAARAGNWDYGLAASHYAGDRIENVTRTGLGNKFVGYIRAGLPVVIDNRYEFAAALVREFDAGIVIDPADIATLPALLRQSDSRRHREGAGRLLAHMIGRNRLAFAAIDTAATPPSAVHALSPPETV